MSSVLLLLLEWNAQLDHIIGPGWKSDEAYIYTDVKIWDTWDHSPIYAMIQEDEIAKYFPAREEEMDWMEAKDRRAKI